MAVPDPVVAGVRLMSDYAAQSPLWIGAVNVTPEHLGLSPDLARRVAEWEECFLTHFGYADEQGWNSASAREWYADRADGLLRDLSDELGADVMATVHLWPLAPRDDASRGAR
jgi:hypothetical protein